jgi:hypothetical protein
MMSIGYLIKTTAKRTTLNKKPILIKNFSQLRAFRNANIIISTKDRTISNGKPINMKGKSLGGPKHDLPFGFIKRKLNITNPKTTIRKTISLIRK